MLPAIIEEYVNKISDKSIRTENRQFYYTTLIKIRDEVSTAIAKYEKEKNIRK